jgi:hypothetical protein
MDIFLKFKKKKYKKNFLATVLIGSFIKKKGY